MFGVDFATALQPGFIPRLIGLDLSADRFAAQNLALLLGRDVLDRDAIAAKLNRIEQETRRASGLVDQMRIFAATGRPNSDSASWRAALTAAVQLLCPGSRGCDVRGWAARGEVVIQVADQASGIPASVLPRVFQPFFTTKQTAREPGLALRWPLARYCNERQDRKYSERRWLSQSHCLPLLRRTGQKPLIHRFPRRFAAVVERAAPAIQRDRAIGVIALEMLVVQVAGIV